MSELWTVDVEPWINLSTTKELTNIKLRVKKKKKEDRSRAMTLMVNIAIISTRH